MHETYAQIFFRIEPSTCSSQCLSINSTAAISLTGNQRLWESLVCIRISPKILLILPPLTRNRTAETKHGRIHNQYYRLAHLYCDKSICATCFRGRSNSGGKQFSAFACDAPPALYRNLLDMVQNNSPEYSAIFSWEGYRLFLSETSSFWKR